MNIMQKGINHSDNVHNHRREISTAFAKQGIYDQLSAEYASRGYCSKNYACKRPRVRRHRGVFRRIRHIGKDWRAASIRKVL